MIPHERSLVQRYKNRPFVLLGVNLDESRMEAQRFEKKNSLPWRSWWDGGDMAIVKRWGVSGLPAVFLLDAQGVIRYAGPPIKEALDREIEKLVAAAEK